MKTVKIFLFLFICPSIWALPIAKQTVHVVDEKGDLVTGAMVSMTFEPVYGGRLVKKNGVTDTNGLFFAQGESVPHVPFSVVKDGYYESQGHHVFVSLNEDKSHYEPWGYTNTVTLRKVQDPKQGKKWGYRGKIPELNEAIGFDLLIGDWVSPYGKGKVKDFIFTCSNNTTNQVASYILTFSNPEDGIIEYPRDKVKQSTFRWPHTAPLTGYSEALKGKEFYGSTKNLDYLPDHKLVPQILSDIGYIFRIRTECDKDGNPIFGYYGRINSAIGTGWDDVIGFSYWINTDPHSRSLENTDATSP